MKISRFRLPCALPFFVFLVLNFACAKQSLTGSPKLSENDSTYIVPLAGNAFVTTIANDSRETISKNGLVNWTSEKSMISTFVRINKAGTLKLSLNTNKSNKETTSQIKVTVNDKQKTITLKSNQGPNHIVGDFKVDTGYVKIDLQGLTKTGQTFAEVESFSISGNATSKGVIYSNDPEYFYWARRGPSCHLSYTITTTENINYYYSEIEVPQGADPIGSYFMANGFSEGYFGFQVNSQNERRILFSVWSPFSTDDPNAIPDDQKIILNKKGNDVHTGEFGNEGSGGQSFLKYNWKAGTNYKFLLKAEPDGNGKTDYTAWFFAPEINQWKLIASFKRPKTNKYLTGFHSFLENFYPNNGHLERTANYKNQWVKTVSGNWKKVDQAKFTVDNTYKAKQRIDAIGGKNQNGFFLKNGGFFNELVTPNSKFIFENSNQNPQIDFNNLP